MSNADIYWRFAEILNAREYDKLGEVMVDDFVDHHPGLVDVTDLTTYTNNLKFVVDALEMVAEVEDVLEAGDKVFTRVKLVGKHVGTFLGIQPTNKPVVWYTNELWRAENGKMVERWAVDDLLSLIAQMDYPVPSWDG